MLLQAPVDRSKLNQSICSPSKSLSEMKTCDNDLQCLNKLQLQLLALEEQKFLSVGATLSVITAMATWNGKHQGSAPNVEILCAA